MAVHTADKEQIEKLKEQWQENRTLIIASVVIAVLAVSGWYGWRDYQIEQIRQASQLYNQLSADIYQVAENQDGDHSKDIDGIAGQLIDDYKSTSYAQFSLLLLASKAVEENRIDKARQYLQQAFDRVGNDEFKHIVRLRLARLFLADGLEEEALSLVEDVTEAGEFSSSYFELKGDILQRQGNLSAAKDAYSQALIKYAGQSNQSLVQMKLDDLGDVQ